MDDAGVVAVGNRGDELLEKHARVRLLQPAAARQVDEELAARDKFQH